jgi:hypothetical protein
MRCDVVIDECSVDEMNVHQLKIKKDVRERKEEKYFAYSRGLIQRREENATLVRIQREG